MTNDDRRRGRDGSAGDQRACGRLVWGAAGAIAPATSRGERAKVLCLTTVHEALGRTGHLGPQLRPTHLGSRIGGTGVTVLCWPGDNPMIHAAVDQRRPGAPFRAGELGLDRHGLRAELAELGVTYAPKRLTCPPRGVPRTRG
ncbi:hypothetical protein [Nonomuraea longispora]|uniref:hypothetical protein n=1 Tax=Nonomuraea longispora TaxID=1848320 RepID=UPI001FEAF7BE|nr:hypothetical protein [Nonomuraea longispora]